MDEFLEQLYESAQKEFMPIIKHDAFSVMERLLIKNQPRRVLEIGTAIGYSAIRILKTLGSEAKLTTVDKDANRLLRAYENFKIAGVDSQITVHNLDAYQYLIDAVEHNEKFDFIFLDGPKGQYLRYYPLLYEILNEGGLLFADNIYFNGLVKHAPNVIHKHRTIAVNLKAFIQKLQSDTRLETEILEIADGIAIAKKQSEAFQ